MPIVIIEHKCPSHNEARERSDQRAGSPHTRSGECTAECCGTCGVNTPYWLPSVQTSGDGCERGGAGSGIDRGHAGCTHSPMRREAQVWLRQQPRLNDP